jgi:hypothetical protein
MKTDYRGLRLCTHCTNGMHFTKRSNQKGTKVLGLICLCERGDCQCPCSQMEEDLTQQAQARKARRMANAKAQQGFPGMS